MFTRFPLCRPMPAKLAVRRRVCCCNTRVLNKPPSCLASGQMAGAHFSLSAGAGRGEGERPRTPSLVTGNPIASRTFWPAAMISLPSEFFRNTGRMLFWIIAGFVFGIVFASLFEWTLHRYVMHQPLGRFNYAFQAHAVVHHQVFKADHTYHLIHEQDKATIPMAWWNGPVLVLIMQMPCLAVALLTGHYWLLLGTGLAFLGYYGTYEYIHWCMHLPRRRNVERTGLFFRLNGHHLLHHRYMHKNFNVVFPSPTSCSAPSCSVRRSPLPRPAALPSPTSSPT